MSGARAMALLLACAAALGAGPSLSAPPHRLAAGMQAYRLAGAQEVLPERPYAALLAAAARRHGLDAALLHALVAVESGYDARARSPKGALGLMQLMPETARRYRVRDPFDPGQNIAAGTAYLRDLLGMFDGDLTLALAAYNAGEAAVLRHGRRLPPYDETREYVPRVLAHYERLRRDSATRSPYRLVADWRARVTTD